MRGLVCGNSIILVQGLGKIEPLRWKLGKVLEINVFVRALLVDITGAICLCGQFVLYFLVLKLEAVLIESY